MFSPTLGDGPLAGTRRETAIERSADALHDLLEWRPPTETPKESGYFMTRDRVAPKALTRRVLFSGNFWMSDTPVSVWRAPTRAEEERFAASAVSNLVSKLIDKGTAAPKPAVEKSFDDLALVPMDGAPDAELQSLQQLSGLELRVEVVRFLKPAPGATGVSTGRVLAVSENYSAQQAGTDRVIVHENKNLTRPLLPGEAVTMEYRDGKAYVYDGIAHDINIVAPWMPREQQVYLRMVMFDALSAMTEPQTDDEKLRDAMRHALESTARHFGTSKTKLRRADIQLVVNEKVAVAKAADPEPAPPARRMRM